MTNDLLDFRSDTVTQPTFAMRSAMLEAPVGDDVFGEDPTINALEQKAAALFGKEAGLFCPSGTMTNQIAIQVHCPRGAEVICAKDAHIYVYEAGGIARNSGASVHLIDGDRGRISAEEVRRGIRHDNIHYPITSLVAIEDTMNRGGGCTYAINDLADIRKVCDDHQLPLHVDGARIFNAVVARGHDMHTYGGLFDSISICLSKGLGAPVGSVLLGSTPFIHQARRARKVLGGGMRQAGILAAAGLYALEHNIERLEEDHNMAKALGAGLQSLNCIADVNEVETNLVLATLKDGIDMLKLQKHCENRGLLLIPFSDNSFRLVTHLDLPQDAVERALKIIDTFPA